MFPRGLGPLQRPHPSPPPWEPDAARSRDRHGQGQLWFLHRGNDNLRGPRLHTCPEVLQGRATGETERARRPLLYSSCNSLLCFIVAATAFETRSQHPVHPKSPADVTPLLENTEPLLTSCTPHTSQMSPPLILHSPRPLGKLRHGKGGRPVADHTA